MKHVFGYLIPILLFSVNHVWADTPSMTPDHNQEAFSLPFVENLGQWEDFISYKADLGMGNFFLEKERMTFFLVDPAYFEHDEAHIHSEELVDCHAFHINFVNSNPTKKYKSLRRKKEYQNYYLGNDPSKWASNVGVFEEIIYEKVFEGIDYRVLGVGNTIKYEFIVEPGANPSLIQLEYDGVDELFIRNNQLHINTAVNTIIEQKPVVYQMIEGQQVLIDCQFRLEGRVLSFDLGAYNPEYELVIDPTLVFSSYSGSSGDNWGFTATYDDLGHFYGAGAVFSLGYPTTTGSFQSNFAGGATDIGVSKFSPSGDQLIYATYLGGEQSDIPHSLIVNSLGQLIVFGTSSSTEYPVSGNAYDDSFNGGSSVLLSSKIAFGNGSDIVVSLLNTDGTDLVGSTYVGGSDNDGLNLFSATEMNYGDDSRGEVIVDEQDNIIIASATHSTDFPTTSGTFSPAHIGQQDGCLFKLSFDLSTLFWGTYIGGDQDDASFSLKMNDTGLIYVSGFTKSPDLPTSPSSIHPTYQGGSSDGYLLCTNQDASQVLHATYLGTKNTDRAYFIDFDLEFNVFVTGQSMGGEYPVTSGVYANPNSNQFIHKLSKALDQTVFSTVFGNGASQHALSPSAFMVDRCNRIYFSGWGGAVNFGATITNLPLSTDAHQTTTDGSDFYFFVLQEDATDIEYASYFGGGFVSEHVDGGTSRFDKTGIIYQAVCAGCGGSSNFPTSVGAYSNTNNSNNCNLGVIKFDFEPPIVAAKAIAAPEFSGCAPYEANFQNLSIGGDEFFWDFDDNATSNEEHPSHTFKNPGIYEVMLIARGLGLCNSSDTVYLSITVLDDEAVTVTEVERCMDEVVLLQPSNAVPNATYTWQDGSNQFGFYLETSGNYWVETALSNCVFKDSFIIETNPVGGSSFEELDLCEGEQISLSSIHEQVDSYEWQDGSISSFFEAGEEGFYWVRSQLGHCFGVDSFYLRVHPSTSEQITVDLCLGDSLQWYGEYLHSDTTAEAVFDSQNGCDSLVNLSLVIQHPYFDTTELQICIGDSLLISDSVMIYEPGVYSDYLKTSYGCDSVLSTLLSFYPKRDFMKIVDDTVLVKLGYSEPIQVVGNFVFEQLQWIPNIYLDCDTCLMVVTTPYHDITYHVYTEDQFGCPLSDSVLVKVDDSEKVYFPNVFSPNNDGYNDFFQLFSDAGVDKVNYLRIYDRWGEMVFEGQNLAPGDLESGWDGSFRGRILDPDVFVYVAELRFLNGRISVYSGDVTLIR